MQAQNWTPQNGVDELRCASHLRKDFEDRARVAVFGSFMGGYHVLSELLFGNLARRVKVVGVATDDPTQSFTNSKVRLWKYPHTQEDEWLVRRLVSAQGLPIFTGRVKSQEFHSLMRWDWRPDLVLMATFGQRIPNEIISLPRLGFFNFHHSGPTWPSYPGPDPIAAIVRDGHKDLVLTMHTVTDVIDGGEFVARSHRVQIPEGVTAIQMHRITWPQMAGFIHNAVSAILDSDSMTDASESSWTMHEDTVGYFADTITSGAAVGRRLQADRHILS